MASKRMFAKAIVTSTRFIKMPSSTQLLYFQLAIEADDEGIVEAFKIMRMIGSSEDDLRILVAKEFIKVLNEDLLTWIIDWDNHNTIRQDRKIPSIYHDELEKYLIESIPCQIVSQVPDICQSSDGQMVDKCQLRLDKIRLDIDKEKQAKKDETGVSVAKATSEIKKEVLLFNYENFEDNEKNKIAEWIEYRKQLKKSYKSTQGLNRLRNSLIQMKKEGQNIIENIEYSMGKEWKDVYTSTHPYGLNAKNDNDIKMIHDFIN